MPKQIKLGIGDLKLGMYVVNLDRPWVDTPFLFQGFNIKSAVDIADLKKYCEYVFVDEELSTVTIPKRSLKNNFKINSKNNPNIIATASRFPLNRSSKIVTKITNEAVLQISPTDVEFKKQLQQAMSLRQTTHSYIKNAITRVYSGKDIDVKKAKGFVTDLAENVVQNPTALMWLTLLKNKDEYTSIHSLNVCILALCFGRSIGLSKLQLVELGLGALLHDIGKLKVPLEVLNKPGKLTSEEYQVMKKHTVFGYDLLKNHNELCLDSLAVIKNHHERLDGHGYPNKLQEHQIGFYPKLVSIVDVYDAISSKRVYHEQITPYDAVNYIYHQQRGSFDLKLVEQFIKYLGIYPIGSTVELNTGQVGIVMSFDDKSRLSPTVLLVLNENKQFYEKYKYCNLAKTLLSIDGNHTHIETVINPDRYGIKVSDIIQQESLCLTEIDNDM